ncbi:Guanylate-binding protein 4 [Microtus ochrogaster]|uniref:Guanylate-binding protein 4 n=1 Tax=Microtus ochrogaster TaxID=79684 RepID=A0A8J6L481_MICOH|nr:Guanylate-binding protein 4 [Microtus ochrogaster]
MCLIENVKGQLRPNQKALEILSAITQPVVVVAIVGLYRTGKSYLMNKLAGKNTGFSLGSTVQSHTKGIWMWCVPHPQKADHTLVLLDTEGLGDIEKLLRYVTELTDQIRTTSSPRSNGTEDSSEFVSFFPDFVWTLRDVTVRLEADGQSLTADEYLENSLKLKQGASKEDKNYNLPRLCIRKFFPRKKCFVFYPPTEWKKLSELENLRDDELDSDFVQQAAEFCSFIFSSSKAKALPGGVKVNGARLEKLVLSYIDAISSGDLPCMENAVLALAKIENLAAMQKAIAHYDQQMSQGVQLPTETLQELLDLHRTCEKEAIEIFLRTSFKDEDHVFQKELLAQLEKRWEVTCNKNVKLSSDLCSELLRNIFSPLEEAVTKGAYSQPGGYLLFVEKREELKKKYLREPRKGIQEQERLLKEGMKEESRRLQNEIQNKKLLVNRRAIEILNSISHPVVVVGIVGMYRTGKSYLMNCLAGQNNGFPLGSTVQSQTKGIWMWCVPHPTKPNHTLILLDTEGLGDVEKGDPTNDAWIFALAVLLSSTFFYNSMSTINNDALEKLHYVTKLTELIRAKSSPQFNAIEDAGEFVSFFPYFIWTVRDFTLELKLDGHCITEDDYLEKALKLIPGQNTQIQTSNWSRECIRQFFPRRKCFVFDWPVSDPQLLAKIESIPESQLNPKFQKQSKAFCSYIFTHASIKKLREGVLVTGNRLGTLVETYVDAINSGTVPCLENAVKTLAERENSIAVQRAVDHYSEQMAQRVRLPTDTLQELLDVHAACENYAITVFMEHSFLDDQWEFQKKLVATIEKRKEAFMLQNEAASLSYCQAELERLSESLMENISCGSFSVPGGHSLYLEVRKKVEQTYEQVPRKGVKANEVFQNFLKSQITIEDSILQSDKALTDWQKAMAAEQAKKEAAEKELELMSQQQTEQEQAKEAQMRTLSENMAQLQKKMESERENLLREQERILDHKIKVRIDGDGSTW